MLNTSGTGLSPAYRLHLVGMANQCQVVGGPEIGRISCLPLAGSTTNYTIILKRVASAWTRDIPSLTPTILVSDRRREEALNVLAAAAEIYAYLTTLQLT